MTWMPGADTSKKATDGNSKMPMKRWDAVCVHTLVGYVPALAAHFSVRWDGYIYQHRSIDFQSAANLQGNPRVIAIENEDHGPAFAGYWRNSSDVPPMTAAQLEANARIIAWACKTKNIPIVAMPNSLPQSRGVAIHRLGCDGNFTDGYPGRVAGGELWTTSFGKICPAVRRIKQTYEIIIPRAQALAGLGGEDMQPDEREWLRQIYETLSHPFINTKGAAHAGSVLTHLWNQTQPVEVEGFDGVKNSSDFRNAWASVWGQTFFGSKYGFGEAFWKKLDDASKTGSVDVNALKDLLVPVLRDLITEATGDTNIELADKVADALLRKIAQSAPSNGTE